MSVQPAITDAHLPAKELAPYWKKISFSMAVAALPEMGRTKIKGTISSGIPIKLSMGESAEPIAEVAPLALSIYMADMRIIMG